jgi:uncharacterized phage protein (TIGR02216 family)
MGLAPEIFWNMTLIEWRAALAGYAEAHGLKPRAPALGRSELDRLMEQFPDG